MSSSIFSSLHYISNQRKRNLPSEVQQDSGNGEDDDDPTFSRIDSSNLVTSVLNTDERRRKV